MRDESNRRRKRRCDGRGRGRWLSLEQRKVNGLAVLKKVTYKGKDFMSYKCVVSPRVAEIVHHHFLRAGPPLRCPFTHTQ